MQADTLQIVELLRPWMKTLAPFQLSSVDGDMAVLTLKTHESAKVVHELGRAIELLHLAAIVDGGLIRDLVRRGCIKVMEETKPSRATTGTTLLEQPGVGIHRIQFVVTHAGLCLKSLTMVLHEIWCVPVEQPQETAISHYGAVRHSLEQRLLQRGQQTRLNEAISIRWCIRLQEETNYRMAEKALFDFSVVRATPLRVFDFFQQLTVIASHKRDYEQRARATGELLLASKPLELALDVPVAVTSSIAQAAEECMRVGGRHIVCSTVMLEPRLLACSAIDLQGFLRALSHSPRDCGGGGGGGHPVGFEVETGFQPEKYSGPDPLDFDGQDRSDLIRTVLRGIGGCDSLQSVELGPLLARFASQPHNRKVFWCALLEDLLSPAIVPPIGVLSLQSRNGIKDDDARGIHELTEFVAPPRRTVHCLRLDVADTNDAGLLAIAALVRDMHTLDLTMPSEQRLSSQTISALLQHHPKLRALRLADLQIASMIAFVSTSDGKCTCCSPARLGCVAARLESLELDQAVVQNASSVVSFLRLLGDPSTVIAQSLHTLKITRVARNRPFLLDQEAALVLERVLQTNETLHTVHVWLDRNVPRTLATALTSHTGEEIIVNETTVDHAMRKVAFLSVVCGRSSSGRSGAERAMGRLDATIAHQIFAFAGPTRKRSVVAQYYFVCVPQ